MPKGGARANSGRKSKAEEFGLAALLDECWSIADRRDVIKKLSSQAADGNERAAALLLAYAYGKPTERTEITGKDGGPIRVIKAEDLTDDELAAIAGR